MHSRLGKRCVAGESKPVPRKEQLARIIKQAIIEGRVEPGERIVESELCKELGASNTAVREVLFELQRQGYVKRLPNRGTYVTQLNAAEAEQVFAVRRVLEGMAAELVEGRLTDDDARALHRIVDVMHEAASPPDPEGFSRADLEFHQFIWRKAGNRFLEEALLGMVGPLFAVFVMRDRQVSGEELERSAARHRLIVESLVRGSGGRALMEDSMAYFRRQRMGMTFAAETQETGASAAAVSQNGQPDPPAPVSAAVPKAKE
jgi:DNA-binding GntR family transcriptional regulator